MPEHLRRSRIHTPGCDWNYTDSCADELIELKRVDRDAYEVLAALIIDAIDVGLDVDDNGGDTYTVPVGWHVDRQRHFSRKPMPWLGELKAEGTWGRQVDYRLYFLETKIAPDGEADAILGSSCPAGKGVAGDYDQGGQTGDMLDAMWRGIKWCEAHDPVRLWRVWE
ncbi:hypothetical protein ERC79_17330 [Rhodococcus sp. ABRD24]|uniref:hypothetical protein n=1 Tax=Rhodococcus sp. ABRD24 TaxID=2507582 RepID=UPI00103E7F37|nr:hypothetical protein [Rhodococcus sp. ABRD24]QBJ97505.1 hypothetical protein ERC79_17330 [Rhodococcus sp. ABRD24]